MVAKLARSVLIADDDSSLRESLREALGERGWETHTVGTAPDAVEFCRVRVVRLAIVDMGMPGLTGLETLQAIHEEVESLPLIAITADRDRWNRDEVLGVGAFDLLWKPLRVGTLVDRMEAALASSN